MDRILAQWGQAAEAYRRTQTRPEDARRDWGTVGARFSDLSGAEVLDVGCGYGAYTDYFCQIGARAVGCDGPPAMPERAGTQYPDCTSDLADLLDPLPYDNGRFDLVLCDQVLMDLPAVDGLFRGSTRILKKKGVCISGSSLPPLIPAIG